MTIKLIKNLMTRSTKGNVTHIYCKINRLSGENEFVLLKQKMIYITWRNICS